MLNLSYNFKTQSEQVKNTKKQLEKTCSKKLAVTIKSRLPIIIKLYQAQNLPVS